MKGEVEKLKKKGFYYISRIGLIRGFYPLLAVLVERWRPETHLFVLPVVILEDVTHIFGLPIDGEPIESIAIFGREPVVNSSSNFYIKLGWVRTIRDAEPLDTEEFIKRYVRCQIFCLLDSTLFTVINRLHMLTRSIYRCASLQSTISCIMV
ncbi:hypothetical protein Ahy_Scaffold6g108183 [Arachis hypogaea]|uniref:Aminotransferase-like plant mobile domain-containing protein n=1 Tax=Arachis hypogaea TaxID=3818 RepID=A0A444WPW5_ARAHY|nr:hypothetical protein Ahy_Scaffold6g108183 [Arachis hypogaea]